MWNSTSCGQTYARNSCFRSNITNNISRRTCSSIQLMTLSSDLCAVFGLTLLASAGRWDWQVNSIFYILQGKSKEALFNSGRIFVHIVDTLIRFIMKILYTLQFYAYYITHMIYRVIRNVLCNKIYKWSILLVDAKKAPVTHLIYK